MIDYTKCTKENDYYFVSNNKTGAVSKLSKEKFIMFNLYQKDNLEPIRNFLLEIKCPENQIDYIIKRFQSKLIKNGWHRKNFPSNDGELMESVYFNITTACNLSCPYCYQGNNKQTNYMTIENAKKILQTIKKINNNCLIIVTGGEPFLHDNFFEIADFLKDLELRFTILTNAVLINDEICQKLMNYENLINIQISLDDMTEKTHRITRGNSFNQVLAGIKNIIKYKIPFSLAPTIHDDNLDEIYDIAHFAYSNGGGFTPNNLRKFKNDKSPLFLSNKNFLNILTILESKLSEEFGKEYLQLKQKGYNIKKSCNNHFTCGVAYSLFSINYNGDVYPCHLLTEPNLLLGNILVDSIDKINKTVDKLGIRKFSYEIEECKDCHFMSTCGSGCRAAIYNDYGVFDKKDPLCEVLYQNELNIKRPR